MSTAIIDTAYGHACCVAVHNDPRLLAEYHGHLVHQVGHDAPTLAEIQTLGAEVSEAWAMGVSPRCFLCGSNVAPGTTCRCVKDGLPFRVPRHQAEAMKARGDKRPACRFACSRCGSADTMTAEQLLRESKSPDGEVLHAAGAPYALCRGCARDTAKAVNAAKAKANAAAAPLLAAARAAALLKVIEAQAAHDGAVKAKAEADAACATALEELNAAQGLRDAIRSAPGSAAQAAMAKAAEEAAQDAAKKLHSATQRRDAHSTRANATLDVLMAAKNAVPA